MASRKLSEHTAITGANVNAAADYIEILDVSDTTDAASGTNKKILPSQLLIAIGAEPAKGADDNYVTDAQLVVIANTSGTNTGDNATNSQYSGLAASKQDVLVSGTSIKTINSTSLLGAGDIAITPATLGLVIGTNVQAYNANLTTYAGIAPSANVQTLLGAADYAAFKTSLSLNSVENTALSTWAGSTNITTLGTISTGTWNATAIGYTKGGTGLTALGSALQVLRTNAGGTAIEWATVSGGASSLSGLTAATATNSIDNTNYAQTWAWSTLTTETGLLMTANGATTGSILSITSSSAAGLTGLKGLNVSLSGANSGASRTTYGAYIENLRTGTTSSNIGIYVSTYNGGTSLITDLAARFIGHLNYGLSIGSATAGGCIWATGITPSNSNYGFYTLGSATAVNATATVSLTISETAKVTVNSTGVNIGASAATPLSQLCMLTAVTATANYGMFSQGTGGFAAGTFGTIGNAQGTYHAINTPSGFTGDFVSAGLNSSLVYRINYQGNLTTIGSLTTGAPTSGTAKAWKLGEVASVSPTAQNRTVRVEIDGTVIYLTGKTTND